MSTSNRPLRVIVNGRVLVQIERRVLDGYRCDEEAWQEIIRQLGAKGLTGDQIDLVLARLILAGGVRRIVGGEDDGGVPGVEA